MMWRPISELPESWKDGREFMAFNGKSGFVVFFDALLERWFQPSQIDDRPFKMNNVTHFAPLFTPETDPAGKLVDALEKLSCLGNGDRPGNSDGNRIAQRALDEFKKVIE